MSTYASVTSFSYNFRNNMYIGRSRALGKTIGGQCGPVVGWDGVARTPYQNLKCFDSLSRSVYFSWTPAKINIKLCFSEENYSLYKVEEF